MNKVDLHDVLPEIGKKLDGRMAECLLLTTPNLIYVYDLNESRYLFINGDVPSIVGYSSDEILAMKDKVNQQLVHQDDAQRLSGHFGQIVEANEGDVFEIEYRVKHAYGDWHWLSVRDTPLIRPEDGKVRYVLGVIEDITERRAAQEKLWYVSTHDQLTGLFNRLYFEAEISRMEKSRRFPISILYVDIVGMRATNDTLGHEGGDDLLRRSAQVLLSAFRAEDVVARIGGDEFAIILPNTGSVSTEAILSRIKSHINSHNLAHRTTPLNLTLGIATVEYGQSLRDAVKSAEKRLYEAKQVSSS